MIVNEQLLCDANNNILLKSYHSRIGVGERPFRVHYHTSCELSLFVSGNGIYETNSEKYHFSPGDVFLFGSNEHHCITSASSESDLLNIHFEPRLLWESQESLELLALFFSRNDNFRNQFSNDIFLQEKILKIEDEIATKRKCFLMEVKHSLFSVLIYILRNFDYTSDKATSPKNHRNMSLAMTKAVNYIDENFEKDLRLCDIANVACLSENYFSSVFKEFNGVSPWRYITMKRVEKAVILLKTTELSKLEIAELCGFSSSSNFYKAFYSITGKTPSDYLQKS